MFRPVIHVQIYVCLKFKKRIKMIPRRITYPKGYIFVGIANRILSLHCPVHTSDEGLETDFLGSRSRSRGHVVSVSSF